MFSILKKELRSFFSSATAYIVIGIFLSVTSLLLWVFPGNFNILDTGYAHVEGLFFASPWLFLFLCPAISMRLFVEEKQTGTWELLITKPLTIWSLVLGKYFAAWILVLLALVPTIIYYVSVILLAEPIGNVDAGAFWGSFIGLVFLSGLYLSIGIFSSSISKNQIVAFVISIVISFFMFYGFELLSSFFSSGKWINFFDTIGINYHYKSMSRGVIDTRDVIYFLVSSMVFLLFTELKISKLK